MSAAAAATLVALVANRRSQPISARRPVAQAKRATGPSGHERQRVHAVSEKQGFQPDRRHIRRVYGAPSCASGEYGVCCIACREPCLRIRTGIVADAHAWLRLSDSGHEPTAASALRSWPLRWCTGSPARSSTRRRLRHMLAALCALATFPPALVAARSRSEARDADSLSGYHPDHTDAWSPINLSVLHLRRPAEVDLA